MRHNSNRPRYRKLCLNAALIVLAALVFFAPASVLKAHQPSAIDQPSLGEENGLSVQEQPGDKFWEIARKKIDSRMMKIISTGRDETGKYIAYNELWGGSHRKNEVALTFDDGPHHKSTLQLLEMLKELDVKATFFVVGSKAKWAPELVKAIADGGHNIGNHTYNHVDLTKTSDEYIAVDIKACGEILRAITGKSPHLFRPPGGDYDDRLARIASSLGYVTVFWTVNSHDYLSPGKEWMEDRVYGWTTNGSIILFHDGAPETMEYLPEMVKNLKARGYRFVTIDEMMGRK